MLDREGRFVVANKQLVSWMGHGDADAVLGKTVFDIFPPDRAPEFAAQDQRIMETGVSEEIPYEWPHLDGETHSYLAQKFPICDSDGEIVGLGVISTDITDIKKAEAAARETDARFRSFIENSPTSIAILDHDGRYVVANQELIERFQVDGSDAIIGENRLRLLPT